MLSHSQICTINNIDLFIRDSDHSADHELRELDSVSSHLSATAIVLSDNSHATSVLAEWSLRSRCYFSFFDEKPLNHLYPGAGIGVSVESITYLLENERK